MIDCVIYFYSSTGNSLTVARMLAEAVGDTAVVSIPGALLQDDAYELARSAHKVGFVFPVHRATLPPIVKRFVAGLPVDTDTYYFALATCSIVGCNEFWELDRLLGLQGGMLNYSTEIPFIGGVGSVTPTASQIEENLENVRVQIPQIARCIKNRSENDPTTNYSKFLDGAVTKFTSTYRRHGKIRVSASCNSCGICAQVCPVDNIELNESGVPIRADRCEGCYACVHWCPTHSLRTLFHFPNRYHNPYIEPEDLHKTTQYGTDGGKKNPRS